MGQVPELTYSEIKSWKQCRFKHHLSYVERLTSREPKSFFRLGNAVHMFIDMMYHEVGKTIDFKTLMGRVDEWSDTLKKEPNQFESEDEAKIELATIKGMLTAYHDHYFVNEKFEGIVTEQEISVEFEGYLLRAKVDAIVLLGDKYWTMEHKTASSFSDADRRLLFIDEQTTHYCMIAQLRYKKVFEGGIRNILKKPTIKQTKKETVDEYCIRLVEDYRSRPEHYLQRIIVDRTQGEIAVHQNLLRGIIGEMLSGQSIFKSPAMMTCGMCEFFDFCTERNEEVRKGILDSKFRQKGSKHTELTK
ncbi:MAG: PD-(D/E)XK nuclease family protein [bacterium]